MLKVLQPQPPAPVQLQPLFVSSARDAHFAEGFYEPEPDSRWMQERGRLTFEAVDQTRYLEMGLYTEFLDGSQELTFRFPGDISSTWPLDMGWRSLSIPVPAGASEVELVVNKIYPRSYYPGDTRTLSIRVRAPHLHLDAQRHAHLESAYRNAIDNRREMFARSTVLKSTPVDLGIDLHGVCNVKPPCVYCDWDNFKEAEGDNVDVLFTTETLREYGAFYDNAASLINCGIGEPFMMKSLNDLLDDFGNRGKLLEMATNGQILTDKNIEKLLGRRVTLFVSLDAATPETYRKLRNDTFDKILGNLRRLIAAKGGRGQYPRVVLVFMPMKVNRHEVDDFVKLCAELGVDEMVLRPLNFSEGIGLDWERDGHHFVYQEQLLPFAELIRISGRVAELCKLHDVILNDQLDFEGESMEELFADSYAEGRREALTATPEQPKVSEAPPSRDPAPSPEPMESIGQEGIPICEEPWRRLYILRRGVYPCCYGQKPLAPMNRWQDVWNSATLRGIRAKLAKGELHPYCADSPSCPVVRKIQHADTLAGDAGPSRSNGRPASTRRALNWVTVRLRRALSDPRYLPRQVSRLWRGSIARQEHGRADRNS